MNLLRAVADFFNPARTLAREDEAFFDRKYGFGEGGSFPSSVVGDRGSYDLSPGTLVVGRTLRDEHGRFIRDCNAPRDSHGRFVQTSEQRTRKIIRDAYERL